jgi:uncharacterized lipoprotein NlpE involved in copper resistance
MKKIPLIIFLLILTMIMFGACNGTKKPAPFNPNSQTGNNPPDIHTTEDSVDWGGIYTGTISEADGPGIEYQITLNYDQTFKMLYKNLDRPDKAHNQEGSFEWDKTGSMIILDVKDLPRFYMVGERSLLQVESDNDFESSFLDSERRLNKIVTFYMSLP